MPFSLKDEHFWFAAAFALPAWLALRILRSHQSRVEVVYGWLLIAHCAWILGQAVELGLTNLQAKLWMDGLQYYPMCAASALQILFAHRITGARVPPGLLQLYGLVAFPTATFYASAPLHGWARQDAHIIRGVPFDALHYAFDSGDMLLTVLMLASGFYGIFVMAVYLRKVDRRQIESFAPILLGFSLPVLVGVVSLVLDWRVLGQRDISFVVFGIAGVCVSWGVRNRRSVVAVPIARDLVLERIPDGAIVVDGSGTILDLNRSASLFLGFSEASRGISRELGSIESARADTSGFLALKDDTQTILPAKSDDAFFAITRHELKDVGAHLFLIRDVTDQERARQVLLAHRDLLQERVEEGTRQLDFTERKFRAIFEESFQLIGLLDTDGTLLQANRAALSAIGKSAEEVIGKPFWETPWWAHSETLRERLKSACHSAAQGNFERFEATHPGPDGLRLVDFSLKPVFDRDGRVTMLIPEGRDITELRATEQQLMQAQKMESLGRLAGGVAHDFNNLLTVISGNVGILLAEIENPKQAESLRETQDAAKAAASLTQQLLTFGRKSPPSSQVLDVATELQQTTSMLRRLLGETISVTLDLGRNLGNLVFDESQLKQLLLNLAINAKDAMPEGGTLTIAAKRTTRPSSEDPMTEWLRIDVKDTGVGMTSETKAHIFEPFFTTKDVGKGTGLGLSMVYGAVTQHGGLVEVESSPGQGACFSLYFTPSKEGPALKKASSDPAAFRVESQTLVYIVEDEPSVRRTLERMMKRVGFEVRCFAHPLEVLEAFDTLVRPELLISDAVMPNMTGFEFLDKTRKKWPGLPTILMSGHAAEERIRETASHGVYFLSKPFTYEGLLNAVQEARDRFPTVGGS